MAATTSLAREPLLSIEEAAILLGETRSTLYRAVKQPDFPTARPPDRQAPADPAASGRAADRRAACPRRQSVGGTVRPPGDQVLSYLTLGPVRCQPEVAVQLLRQPPAHVSCCRSVMQDAHQRADHAVVLVGRRRAADRVPCKEPLSERTPRRSLPRPATTRREPLCACLHRIKLSTSHRLRATPRCAPPLGGPPRARRRCSAGPS